MNVSRQEGKKGEQDIRDETSLWVHTKKVSATALETDCSTWYLEASDDTLLEQINSLKEKIKQQSKLIQSQQEKIEEIEWRL